MKTTLKFERQPETDQFAQTLRQRIDNYFSENNISRHANGLMYFKSFLSIAGWIGSYILLLLYATDPVTVILFFLVHGFWQLFMAFNISHDANHQAYSSNQRINKLLSYSFDVVGVNSYMWRLMHNQAHHAYVNIEGVDVSIETNGLFRFAPQQKWRPFHRYQHLYAPFMYCLATFEWVLFKDFNWFFLKKDIGLHKNVKHPISEIVTLLAFKAFYFTYTLVIPILVLPVAFYWILLAFLIMHFFIGFTIAIVFQTTHVIEESHYPVPNDAGEIDNHYMLHILENTADYSWRRPITNFFLGCLNVHVIHHIFPGICHVHYPELTKIVIHTSADFGYRYRENPTIFKAFREHLKMLKRLGAEAEVTIA